MLDYFHKIKISSVPGSSTGFCTRLCLLFLLPLCFYACAKEKICIPEEELRVIGQLIFINEGAGKTENLTAWNEGEEFASLGIGHFLWYPRGKEYPYVETFPELLEFLSENGAQLPGWIREMPDPELPWSTRGEFYADFESPEMQTLRDFLLETVPLQSLFMARRLERSLPGVLEASPESRREHVKTQFYRVANSPMGMYVLIDYVNFKGEGIAESERYRGQGWGLLQVLNEMDGSEPGPGALQEFSEKAELVLVRRINNSPPERDEKRWLPGWRKRIGTYVNPEYAALVGERDVFCREGVSLDRIRSFLRYLASRFSEQD